jgi:hypothetical protein
MVVCVYALASAVMPQVTPITGIARERVRAVRIGGITAFVGHVRRMPPPGEPILRRFDRVVRHLFVAVPALLPARFGTRFDTLDELTTVLRLRQASLRRALRVVRGRAQMTVRVVETDSAAGSLRETRPTKPNSIDRLDVGRGPRSEPATIRPVTTGADYLRGRAEEAARQRAVIGFEPVRASVARLVRAEHVDHRAGVATIYHLVPRAAAVAYRAAVERSAAAADLHCVVTGPWPPYAFTDW